MARALGTNPTPIPAGEIYTALQTGVVDGMEATADFSRSFRLLVPYSLAWLAVLVAYVPALVLWLPSLMQ